MRRLLLLVVAVVGCGGSTSKSQSNPDLAMSMSTNPDMAGMTMGGCGADNAACSIGGANGLCKGGLCSSCTDTTDDSACAAAYSGTLCAGGNCMAGCHDSSTCNGQVCDPSTFTCRACTQDADCSAGQFCDPASGKCGSTPPACMVGLTGECCADSDCATGGTCDVTHTCNYVVNCPSPPPANTFYVDPDATAGFSGKGSKQCPFKTIAIAINHVSPSPAPATFTICTRGAFNGTNTKQWPINVPTNIELDGTNCGASTAHTTLSVPAMTTGVAFQQLGPSSIHGFDITSLNGTQSKAANGIFVSGTGSNNQVSIYDVNVSNFLRGIYVTTGVNATKAGNALIRHDSIIDSNGTGLLLDSNATVDVNVTDPMYSATHAEFDNNTGNGIEVGKATLTVEGQLFTGTGASMTSRTVRADGNGNDGIKITANGANVTLKQFSASNGNDDTGLSTVNLATVKVRSSTFVKNKNNGIYIFNAQGTTSEAVSSIDLGKDASSDPGKNTINNNGEAGVCLAVGGNPPDVLEAQGNIFSGNDCSAASPSGSVTVAEDCTRALDVAGAYVGSGNGLIVSVNNCGKLDCFNHKTTGGCPQ